MNYNNDSNLNEMYDYYLEKVLQEDKNNHVSGIWKKYDQGVDYEGLNPFEKTQLSQGDLYIYYTKDLDGNYSNSRLTIYMNGNDKVVGVSSFLEDYSAEKNWLSVVAAEKVESFSNRGEFLTCIYNTYLLNEIEKKINDNLQLTKEEIKLLYQIDCSPESFGSLEEPRIKRLKSKRDFKTDIAYFYDLSLNNVGTNLEDFDKNEIVCYLGDIVYDGKTVPDKFKNLKYVYGNLCMNNVEVSDNLGNLEEVDSLYMNHLQDASGLYNFKRARVDCFLSSLPKAKGLENFEKANFVNLNGLEDASGLGLKYVNHNLGINSLTSSKGFENLEYVGMNIFCKNLEDTIGFTNLQSVNGRPAEEFISGIEKRNNSLKHKAVKILKRGKR